MHRKVQLVCPLFFRCSSICNLLNSCNLKPFSIRIFIYLFIYICLFVVVRRFVCFDVSSSNDETKLEIKTTKQMKKNAKHQLVSKGKLLALHYAHLIVYSVFSIQYSMFGMQYAEYNVRCTYGFGWRIVFFFDSFELASTTVVPLFRQMRIIATRLNTEKNYFQTECFAIALFSHQEPNFRLYYYSIAN